MHRKSLDKLSAHQRTLFEIIDARGEIAPTDLYSAYRERVREPKTDRTVRNCLRKMGAHYDLVVAEGTSRDRTYRAQSAEADH